MNSCSSPKVIEVLHRAGVDDDGWTLVERELGRRCGEAAPCRRSSEANMETGRTGADDERVQWRLVNAMTSMLQPGITPEPRGRSAVPLRRSGIPIKIGSRFVQGLTDAPVREARRPPRARGGAVQRRDRARCSGQCTDRDRRVLRAGARRGAGDRLCRVAAAGARARRAGTGPLPAHLARGVPGARGDRDAAVRRQPARGPDRHPRHPGRGAVGSRRDRHRDVDRRRARRRARARRPAARGRARRLRGRRSQPGGKARRSASVARSRSTRRVAPRSCSPGR